MDVKEIRNSLLKILDAKSKERRLALSTRSVLVEVARKYSFEGHQEKEQLLLTIWHDLLRTGYIAWGLDLANTDPPFCHITERGRKMLEKVSRDPGNEFGYKEYLKQKAALNTVASSYIEEALHAYNSNSFRASAVMIGGATESMIIELKDEIVAAFRRSGTSIPKGLNSWKVKTILDSIEGYVNKNKKDLPKDLHDQYSSYFSSFSSQIRLARNEAGHPSSIDSVTEDTVHASLLIFPELAELIINLKKWVKSQ